MTKHVEKNLINVNLCTRLVTYKMNLILSLMTLHGCSKNLMLYFTTIYTVDPKYFVIIWKNFLSQTSVLNLPGFKVGNVFWCALKGHKGIK